MIKFKGGIHKSLNLYLQQIAICCSLLFVQAHAIEFAGDIERSRQDPEAFKSQYARELFDYNRSIMAELIECYQASNSEDQLTISQALAPLNSFVEVTDGRRFQASKILQHFGYQTPVEVYALTGSLLEDAHYEVSKICAKHSDSLIGGGHMRDMLDQFADLLRNPVARAGLQASNAAIQWAPASLKRSAIEKGVQVASPMAEALPFFDKPWFVDVLVAISDNPDLVKAAEILFSSDVESMISTLEYVFEQSTPYEIDYPELWASNQKYPFVHHLRQNFWSADTLFCAGATAELLEANVSMDSVATIEEEYEYLVSKTLEACPEISRRQATALLNVEDRMTSWLLPRSVTLYFIDNVKANAVLESPEDGDGSSLYKVQDGETNLFSQFSGVERLSYWHKKNTARSPLNHYVTPLYLTAISKDDVYDPEQLEAAVIIAGIAYQVFDSQNKIEDDNHATESVVEFMMIDLELWVQGTKDAF
ncbi:MAG: hypothetical protein AAF202_04180 [Pseudomonadota bacterium]